MSRPEVLQFMPLTPIPQADADDHFTIHKLHEASDREALIAEVEGRIRGVLTNGHIGISNDLMARLTGLEMIGCYGVGVDAIDLEAAKARGIRVSNTPEVLTEAVAELALGLLLDVARRISFNDRYVRAGRWPTEGDPRLSNSLAGRRIGIVGLGRIGQAIAKLAEAFGMVVSYTGPRAKPDQPYPYVGDMADLARAVDVLMVSCLGAPSTRGIVTREVIDALGPESWLINVSRGFVVDEEALVEALVAGRIGGAGLDVFLDEPRVPEALLGLDNVVLQPHQASATIETRTAMGQLTVDNMKAYFEGRPLLTPVV